MTRLFAIVGVRVIELTFVTVDWHEPADVPTVVDGRVR